MQTNQKNKVKKKKTMKKLDVYTVLLLPIRGTIFKEEIQTLDLN